MSENKKISELSLVTSNASGDIFPLVQNGVTQRTTLSKISTYLGTIFTTTSAVASQITAALVPYATTASLVTKQGKQSIVEINIDASTTSTLDFNNCILSITNLPNNGNKEIKIRDPFYTTGDFQKDKVEIARFYQSIPGVQKSWIKNYLAEADE